MDLLPLHPKIVHLPIALSVLMPFVSLGMLLAWVREWLPRRAFVVAVVLQAALVGGAFAGLRSGEADEEQVELVVDEAHIEEHEDAAKAFTGAAFGVLALMIAAAVVRDERVARAVAALSLLGTFAVLGLGYRAGTEGGELVYVHGAVDAYRADGVGSVAEVLEPHGAAAHDEDEE